MRPVSPAAATPTSLADRLATLVEYWQTSSSGNDRPTPPAEFDAFRHGLLDLALEAEVADRAHLARVLRRIARLSEVWEWLECEPEQAISAAEVAGFCLAAI